MLADIVTGEHGTADVLFLIAAIVAVLAALSASPIGVSRAAWSSALGWIAVALLAVAWLVL